MSSQRTLLGERRERAGDQVGWKVVNELRTPKEIVIDDDSRDCKLFSDAIFVAPRDEILEGTHLFNHSSNSTYRELQAFINRWGADD